MSNLTFDTERHNGTRRQGRGFVRHHVPHIVRLELRVDEQFAHNCTTPSSTILQYVCTQYDTPRAET